jgi:predicted nucleic acid-binding protein
MIVLDTSVLSESLRPQPSSIVLDWLHAQPVVALFTTAITEAEIYLGIALLPQGNRRRSLELAVGRIFTNSFSGRILPFDSAAAREYAVIAVTRRRLGRPISEADARIAAIARSRGAPLATRNTEDFEGCDLEVLNPWH